MNPIPSNNSSKNNGTKTMTTLTTLTENTSLIIRKRKHEIREFDQNIATR